jgi:hypothetical protein
MLGAEAKRERRIENPSPPDVRKCARYRALFIVARPACATSEGKFSPFPLSFAFLCLAA